MSILQNLDDENNNCMHILCREADLELLNLVVKVSNDLTAYLANQYEDEHLKKHQDVYIMEKIKDGKDVNDKESKNNVLRALLK